MNVNPFSSWYHPHKLIHWFESYIRSFVKFCGLDSFPVGQHGRMLSFSSICLRSLGLTWRGQCWLAAWFDHLLVQVHTASRSHWSESDVDDQRFKEPSKRSVRTTLGRSESLSTWKCPRTDTWSNYSGLIPCRSFDWCWEAWPHPLLICIEGSHDTTRACRKILQLPGLSWDITFKVWSKYKSMLVRTIPTSGTQQSQTNGERWALTFSSFSWGQSHLKWKWFCLGGVQYK